MVEPFFEVTKGRLSCWLLTLSEYSSLLSFFRSLLTEEECGRADRFYFPLHRERFTLSRGLLRTLCGAYLNCPAAEVRFETGPYGKPFFSPKHPDTAIEFNMSHSEDRALFVFAAGIPVGADIEYMKKPHAYEGLVSRFFSVQEQHEFFSLPPDQRREAFYNGWTRKEAVIKATGQGLHMALSSFDVTLTPGSDIQIRGHDGNGAFQWYGYDLDCGPDYKGAVVTSRADADISVYHDSFLTKYLL